MIKLSKYHKSFLYLRRNRKIRNDNLFIKRFCCRQDFIDLFDFFQDSRYGTLSEDLTRNLGFSFTSKNGTDIDAIEGVSRYLPYLSANIINMPDKNRHDNLSFFFKTIINGTDNNSSSYWGDPCDYDQLICEMSDIALSIWLLRDYIDDYLDPNEKNRLLLWLSKGVDKKVYSNNWILFKIKIQIILKTFNVTVDVSKDEYNKIKKWYSGDGWFKDGNNGEIDYYSCWGFCYSLFWIQQIDPHFDNDFICNAITNLGQSYLKIIPSNSIPPFFGRSLSYRLSACCPVLCSAFINDDKELKYASSKILKDTYSYFSKNNSFVNGRITSGYYSDNLNYVDNYSGQNSSLWSLRSLVISEYMLNNKIDIYDIEEKNACHINDGNYHLCNGLMEVIRKDDKVTIKNKTLKYKGYKNTKIIKAKVLIKNIITYLLYFRIERIVKYRENFESYFSSSNSFYKD